MEENVTILTQTSVFISTAAAAISALFAGLALSTLKQKQKRPISAPHILLK